MITLNALYTQNVAVKIRKDGNKEYEKKEPIRRKTDGFQAFIHALYRADDLKDSNLEEEINLFKLEILKEGGSKLWDYSISYSKE